MSNGAIRFSEEVEYYTPEYIVDKFGPVIVNPHFGDVKNIIPMEI